MGSAGLAVLLWERAAQQGNLEALLKLGDAHYSGRGTPRNWAQSAKVLAVAARQSGPTMFIACCMACLTSAVYS